MREIKIRAFNKVAKRMFMVNDIEGMLQNTIVTCKHGDACECMEGISGWLDEVILMQYIGLKDKNGTEIYEGDIIQEGAVGEKIWQFTNLDTEHTIVATPKGVVYFEAPIFNAKTDVIGTVDGEIRQVYLTAYDGCCHFENIEVIGNIHENPSLLAEASPKNPKGD